MAERAQRANGLGRHRHGADGPSAFGDAVAVISTKPLRRCRAGALRDAQVTDKTAKESGAEFCNGKAMAAQSLQMRTEALRAKNQAAAADRQQRQNLAPWQRGYRSF